MPFLEHDSAYSLLFTQPIFFDELYPHNRQMRDLLVPPELNYHGLLELPAIKQLFEHYAKMRTRIDIDYYYERVRKEIKRREYYAI